MKLKEHYLNNIFFGFATLLLFSACGAKEVRSENPWEGSWVGSVDMKPFPDLMQFHYDSVGSARLFYSEVDLHQLAEVTIEGSRISFPIDYRGFKATFTGIREENIIKGSLDINGEIAETNLVKIKPEGLGRLGDMLGFYEFGPGHIVELSPFFLDISLTPLAFTDFRSGSRRVAFPAGDGKYAAGPQMLNPYPEEISFHLPTGKDTADYDLVVNDPALGEIKGKRLADLSNQQDINVEHDGIAIASTITYPNTEAEKYPLVIFVPGAGESTRESAFNDYIKLLPYYGVATLTYDKRGCGESGGDMRNSSFEDFASDIVAVAEAVAKLDKIDAQQIGLLGVDQASYSMPLAAMELPNLNFMVMVSGSVLSMEKQEYQAAQRRMKADGFSEQDIQAAQEYQTLMFNYLDGKADSLTFQQAADAMESEKWANYVTSFNNKQYINWWRRYHNFNPTSAYQQLNIPILAFYGTQDVLLDAAEHKAVLEGFLTSHTDTVSHVITYDGANHFLILGESRGDFQFSEIVGYAPGLFNEINEWVVRRFGIME